MPGIEVDIASYYGTDYRPRLAVRPLSESGYIELSGVCEGVWGCRYVGESDTLVEIRPAGLSRYAYVHANLRSRIRYDLDVARGLVSARFDAGLASPLKDATGRPLPVGELATSRNGHWLLVEVRNVGLVRMDLETGELRHISSPVGMYGMGRDPLLQMVISEDGHVVVSIGALLLIIWRVLSRYSGG